MHLLGISDGELSTYLGLRVVLNPNLPDKTLEVLPEPDMHQPPLKSETYRRFFYLASPIPTRKKVEVEIAKVFGPKARVSEYDEQTGSLAVVFPP